MEYIDLTHTFKDNMPVFPGDPPAEVKQTSSVEKDGYSNYEIKTHIHVGTHMDGPAHMVAGGRKLSDIPVERFFGRGVLIDLREYTKSADRPKLYIELLETARIEPRDIVLVLTGWSSKYGQEEYYKSSVLSENFAEKLVELKVNAVGLDAWSPDSSPYKVHKILLPEEILIIENLTNLEQLINKDFEVVALPIKLDADSAPVRVVAILK